MTNSNEHEQQARHRMNQRVGKFLAERRLLAGITQRQISNALKLTSAQYCSNIENGTTPPSLAFLTVWQRLTRCNRTELLTALSEANAKYLKSALKW